MTNQKGMGLVPFLVTTFVVGLIVAGMASSILTMLRSQVSVAATAEATLLADQLQAVLTNEASCANALANKVPDPPPALGAEPPTPIAGVSVRLGDQDVALAENAELYPGSGFTLVRFRMHEENAAPIGANGLPSLVDAGEAVFNKRIKITLQLRKSSEGILSPLSQKKEFFVDANTRQVGNTIKSCAARSVASEACSQMGGVWNPSLGVDPVTLLPVEGNRCVSNQHCQYGGSYSGPGTPFQASFPNATMNPPAFGCPAGFFPKQTGAVALANAVNKETVNTTIAPIISCLRCAQQDRAAIVLTAQTGTLGSLAQGYIDDAITESQAVEDTSNNVLVGSCNTALATSGDWLVNYSSNDCGPVGSEPSGPCDPREPPRSGSSADCGYPITDPMTGFPIGWVSLFTTYTATCPQVRALPPQCSP